MSTNNSYKVTLLKSGKTIQWDPGKGSLLELCESAGLNPEHSCRVGTCATCASKLVSGTYEYDPEPFFEPDNHLLICCAVPTSDLEIEL